MALPKPGPGDRANCPSGGAQFALTVWRYVRLLAAAARAQGARLDGDSAAFEKLDSYLDSYLDLLRVRPPSLWKRHSDTSFSASPDLMLSF